MAAPSARSTRPTKPARSPTRFAVPATTSEERAMAAQPSHSTMDDERIELPEPEPPAEPEPEDTHPHHEQTGSLGESVGLEMRLVVSPAAGRLRLLPAARFHDG